MRGRPSLLRVGDIEEIVRRIHGEVARIVPLEAWAQALVSTIRTQLRGAIGVHLAIDDGEEPTNTVVSSADGEPDAGSPAWVRIERVVDDGLRFVLQVRYPRSHLPVFNDRDLLARLGLHLEAALRLRLRPGRVRGYVGVSALASIGPSPLSRAEVWSSIVRGDASLVPRSSWAGTELVIVEVRRAASSRALATDERAVLQLFARGATSKRIGRELGLSQPVVSRCLSRAAAKIGVTSTRELFVVVSRLGPLDAAPGAPAVGLTPAEREVLALVRDGLSNQAIARQRVRSHRTVANQLASLLRKMGCDSRRALASIVMGDSAG